MGFSLLPIHRGSPAYLLLYMCAFYFCFILQQEGPENFTFFNHKDNTSSDVRHSLTAVSSGHQLIRAMLLRWDRETLLFNSELYWIYPNIISFLYWIFWLTCKRTNRNQIHIGWRYVSLHWYIYLIYKIYKLFIFNSYLFNLI